MKKNNFGNITWIDIENPQKKDIERLKSDFNINSIISKQLLKRTPRPRVEKHKDQIFTVLHFPVFYPEKEETWPTELDFIITKDTLITLHCEPIPYLDTFFNDCKLQKYHQKKYFKNVDSLIFGLLAWLHESCLPMLDHISEKIEEVENNSFKGKEKEMLWRIATVKKDLIDFRQSIKPQPHVLNILSKKVKKFFNRKSNHKAREVISSCNKVWDILEDHWEWINSIEQTNNSLLSYKLNDTMRFLTALSFIMFPLSIIVGFFGMNFKFSFLSDKPQAWMYILASMVFLTIIMLVFFKKKKWI